MRQPDLLKPDPQSERQGFVTVSPRQEAVVAPVFAERASGDDPRLFEQHAPGRRESGDSLFAEYDAELPLVW